MSAFLFDLDMTLVDSSALAQLRSDQRWRDVEQNLHLIRQFTLSGKVAPHTLPERLKGDGQAVGIITSSPGWYARAVLSAFNIAYDVLVSYEDTANHKPDPEPLEEALTRLCVSANREVYYIGDDVGDVEAAFHAGLTSVAVGWGPTTTFELASAAPDIFIRKPELLLRRKRLSGRTYIGEALTGNGALHLHWGSILRCDDNPAVYALGRYFPTADPRHATSTLSAAVLSLKSEDTHATTLGECVGRAVAKFGWTPDYIVSVPMKPSQTRNRFKTIMETAALFLDENIEVRLDGLRCVKDVDGYKKMNALERKKAIEGVFETEYDWSGDKVLLIDDVYTTGGTANECTRVLRENGATGVRILAMAKDQRVFSRKICSACGRPMRVRTNQTTQAKFWGCSGYPDECQNTEVY